MLFFRPGVNYFLRTKFAILIYMDIETLLKNTSRSLYLSVQALPGNMRPAFGIAYLLCRYADTIADTSILPAQRRLYWIERFPLLLKEQNRQEISLLASEICGGSENPYEKELKYFSRGALCPNTSLPNPGRFTTLLPFNGRQTRPFLEPPYLHHHKNWYAGKRVLRTRATYWGRVANR